MKQIPVRQLKPGMVTASDVITKRGQLIAQKGTALTSQLIARLSFYRIESVDIDMPEEEKPAPQPEAPGQHVPEDARAGIPCRRNARSRPGEEAGAQGGAHLYQRERRIQWNLI